MGVALPEGVVVGRAGSLDEFLSPAQVAEILAVSVDTVRRLARQRTLRSLEVVPGTFRIRRRWVEEFVEENS